MRKAHASCSTCGFFVPLAGPLRRIFGICANEWAADDGRVVSLDHGCGAHSETDLPDQGAEWPVLPSRLDESAMEPLGTDGVSLRGGLSRDQAEALAAGIDQELAGQLTGAGAEPDAGARSADEAAEPDTGAEPDAGARSADEAAESDAGAPGAVDSPQETESIAVPPSNGALSTEDRRASALTAVADLAAGLGIVTETQEEILVPRSLEELEARLPFRD